MALGRNSMVVVYLDALIKQQRNYVSFRVQVEVRAHQTSCAHSCMAPDTLVLAYESHVI